MKELPADHKYIPGYASLAMEILKQAIEDNTNKEHLSKSLWANYLLYHEKLKHRYSNHA